MIDHHGIIRKRWIGAPALEVLEHSVDVLVDVAEKHVPADAMKPIVAALTTQEVDKSTTVETARPAVVARPGTGFIDKVYRGTNGFEAKYTVFVPPIYDGTEPVPVILYLHGSGAGGTDGRTQLETGLAKAIRDKNLDFPFLAIFPQTQKEDDWDADSPGGRLALAILTQVENDYRTDHDRVALTGESMGAAGVWSLAAADANRWSAIVPICHGGDPSTAAKLVRLPCWCFHVAADRMIPPEQSREMLAAITKAGGHPLY